MRKERTGGELLDSSRLQGLEVALSMHAHHRSAQGKLFVASDGTVVFDPEAGSKAPGCCTSTLEQVWLEGADVVGATTNAASVHVWCTAAKLVDGRKRIRKLLKHCFAVGGDVDARKAADAVRAAAAWGGRSAPPRLLVLINPKSGQGKAPQLYETLVRPMFDAAGADVRVVVTQRAGHASEVARTLNLGSVECIACAGGDGTSFEVLQGLMARPDWQDALRTPLAQLPCGTGNALCANAGYFNPVAAAHAVLKGATSPLDVASVLQPSTGKRWYSFLSLTYGLITNMDIGTEHLRWMGNMRVVYGGVKQLVSYTKQPADVAIVRVADAGAVPRGDGGGGGGVRGNCPAGPSTPLLDALAGVDVSRPFSQDALPPGWTHLGPDPYAIFMCCNLPWLDNDMFRPAARAALASGCMDLVATRAVKRVEGLQMLLDSDKVADMPGVQYEQLRAIVLRPAGRDTWVALDGEALPFETVMAELHAGLATLVVAPEEAAAAAAAAGAAGAATT